MAQPSLARSLAPPTLHAVDHPRFDLPTARRRARLPDWPTAFVGRTAELLALGEAAAASTLLTVCGAGGMGKTRLVGEAVGRGELNADLRLCDLPDADHPADVAERVAARLCLAARVDPLDAVGRQLAAAGPAVLWLDVAAPAVDAVRGAVAAWLPILQAAQGDGGTRRILVTCREPLGLAEESVLRLGTLAEAPALFRARLPRRAPAVHDDASLRAVLSLLAGVPLAIELAAAWVGQIGLDGLATRLSTAPGPGPVQRAFDVSLSLLADREVQALVDVSVFAGELTLTDAEAVLDKEGEGRRSTDILDLLEALTRRGFLTLVGPERFRMLDTTRQCLALRAAPGNDVLARHATWAVERGEDLERAGAFDLLTEHVAELDAVRRRFPGTLLETRAAAASSPLWQVHATEPTHRARLDAAIGTPRPPSGALGGLFLARGALHEGAERPVAAAADYHRAIAHAGATHPATNALAWCGLGRLKLASGRADEAERLHALANAIAADAALALPRCGLLGARLLAYRGCIPAALEEIERVAHAARDAGDSAVVGEALVWRGVWSHGAPSSEDPRALIAAGVERLGRPDRLRVWALGHLANACLLHGDVAGALEAADRADLLAAAVASPAAATHHARVRAWVALYAGRPEDAVAHLRRVRCSEPEHRALLAVGLHLAGHPAAACAEARGLECPGPAVALFEAVVHATNARHAMERGAVAEAGAEVALARTCAAVVRTAAPPLPGLRLIDRLVDDAAIDAWWFASDGSWFAGPGGPFVSLERRGSVRRVIALLAHARAAAPDQPLTVPELVAGAWPSERLPERTARNRLFVVLNAVRGLGLEVERRPGPAYLLDPDARVVLVEPGAHRDARPA